MNANSEQPSAVTAIDIGQKVSTTPAAIPSSEVVLQGQLVTLEGLKKAHIPDLFEHLGLPEDKSAFDWLPWKIPDTEDELWDTFENLRKNRGFIVYAIKADAAHLNHVRGASGPPPAHETVLGTIGYLEVQPQNRALETGAVLFSPALRRTAAATEAHFLLLCNVLDEIPSSSSLPYRRVSLKCNSLNIASQRAAQRIGYVYEGTFRNHMISKGYSRDTDWLSIVDDEWNVVRLALEGWLEPINFDEDGKQRVTLEEFRASISNIISNYVPTAHG